MGQFKLLLLVFGAEENCQADQLHWSRHKLWSVGAYITRLKENNV